MKTSDKKSLEFILKHKDHFDQKLLEIIDHLSTTVDHLSLKNTSLSSSNQSLIKSNHFLTIKCHDLKAENDSLKKQKKEADKEKNDALDRLDELQKEIERLATLIEKQEKEIKQQDKEIEKQKNIINKLKYMNSSNSNFPSSFDVVSHTKTKANANTRVKTGRKRGGQPHHQLHKSQLLNKPDQVICVHVKKAPDGAKAVKNNDGRIEYYVTQEVDMVLKSVIKETRYYIDAQGNQLDQKTMKKYAVNPLVYSSHFKAAMVYLNERGTIPFDRLSKMVHEISGGSIQVRPSTISGWCQECYAKSQKHLEEILGVILKEPVIHVDETGVKISGTQNWMHTITNEKGSYYVCTEKRGDRKRGPVSLLELYTGIVVHDHFSTYQGLLLCKHAECNAHIDRYLKAGIDFEKSEACEQMLSLLHAMLHRKHELVSEGKTSMPAEEIAIYETAYDRILNQELEKYPDKKCSKKDEPEYIKTFRRLRDYKEDHLRFMKEFIVPYTNNRAEQKCRVVKGKKNVSGQFVTKDGADAYAGITSIIQTSLQNKESALNRLAEILVN